MRDGIVPVMEVGNNGNNNGFCNGFGDGFWWIIILFLFVICGWGNGNNGFLGNGGGMAYTDSAIQRGFDNQAVINKLNGLENGLCDGFYAVNTSILNLGQSLLNCCCEVKTGIMQNGYETRSAINDLGYRLQDCCCQNLRAIDGVNYNMAMNTNAIQNAICNNTRDILENNNNNTRAILDFLTQDKISTLQSENQTLKFQASQTAQNAFITANQEAQTAELIRRLGADCPQPAYVVQPPQPVTFPTNCCGQFNGFNNGYSCNNGCNCGNY